MWLSFEQSELSKLLIADLLVLINSSLWCKMYNFVTQKIDTPLQYVILKTFETSYLSTSSALLLTLFPCLHMLLPSPPLPRSDFRVANLPCQLGMLAQWCQTCTGPSSMAVSSCTLQHQRALLARCAHYIGILFLISLC